MRPEWAPHLERTTASPIRRTAGTPCIAVARYFNTSRFFSVRRLAMLTLMKQEVCHYNILYIIPHYTYSHSVLMLFTTLIEFAVVRSRTTATGSQEKKTSSDREDPCAGLASQRDVSRSVKFSDDCSAPTAGWEMFVGVRHSFFRSYTSIIGLMTRCRIFLHLLVTEERHRVKSLQKRALARDQRQCKGFRHPTRTSRQLDKSKQVPRSLRRNRPHSTAYSTFHRI